MRKKIMVLLALFALIIVLGVVLVPRGYPDWALNVMQREGTTFVVTGSVDANITNTEINAYVTNSTITIEPSSTAEFIIKPAEAVVFQIQGSVDANITNTELDVHVTNSTITIEPGTGTVFEIKPATEAIFNIQGDVNITNTELNVNVTNSTLNVTGDVNATIQGTASISIDNATITVDVATVREKASELGNLDFHWGGADVDPGGSALGIDYTNTNNYTLHLEMITFSILKARSSDPDVNPLNVNVWFKIEDDSGNTIAAFEVNPPGKPINFDPAIPILPNWKIYANVNNMQDSKLSFEFSYIFRKP